MKKQKIVFLGPISHERLSHLLNSSKLFLFTSTWEEPFGMVLIEAISTRTPVIANDVGCVKKIISRGAGVVIERNNWSRFTSVLKDVLKNEKKLTELRDGEVLSKSYDWNIIVKKITYVYKSVLNQHRRF